MGKTETAKMFAGLGLPIYDADAAVRELYSEGGAAVGAIGRAFPAAVKNGAVDRQALSRIIASEDDALQRLEEIVHPLVRDMRRAFLARVTAAGAPMAVLDIPLLFETGSENDVDVVIVVSAPEDVQRARVRAPGDDRGKVRGYFGPSSSRLRKTCKSGFRD